MNKFNVYSASFGKVTAVSPTINGRTLIRVKSSEYGNLYYYVDVCYIEEGENVDPKTVLGILYKA